MAALTASRLVELLIALQIPKVDGQPLDPADPTDRRCIEQLGPDAVKFKRPADGEPYFTIVDVIDPPGMAIDVSPDATGGWISFEADAKGVISGCCFYEPWLNEGPFHVLSLKQGFSPSGSDGLQEIFSLYECKIAEFGEYLEGFLPAE
jgi:hypothetical protein